VENDQTDRPRFAAQIVPAALAAAALLAAGAAAAFGYGAADGMRLPAFTAAAALAAVSALSLWWYLRARGRARWRAAVDAYAEREIVRARRRGARHPRRSRRPAPVAGR
jgi:hypothetical protein